MRIGEYQLQTAVMPASDMLKTIGDVRRMVQTDAGAILAGTFILDDQALETSTNDELDNIHSLGLRNQRMDKLLEELPEMIKMTHDAGKPFILNIAPLGEDPVEEITALAQKLAAARVEGLDGIELNASCPNVLIADGGHHELLSHHPERLAQVLLRLDDIAMNLLPFRALGVQIAPFRQAHDVRGLVRVVGQTGVDFVSAFHTFSAIPGNEADKRQVTSPYSSRQSSQAQIAEAEQQTHWLAEARNSAGLAFDIIGSNGVVDAETMKRRLDLGAAAVSCRTLYQASTDWARTTRQLLDNFAALQAS